MFDLINECLAGYCRGDGRPAEVKGVGEKGGGGFIYVLCSRLIGFRRREDLFMIWLLATASRDIRRYLACLPPEGSMKSDCCVGQGGIVGNFKE